MSNGVCYIPILRNARLIFAYTPACALSRRKLFSVSQKGREEREGRGEADRQTDVRIHYIHTEDDPISRPCTLVNRYCVAGTHEPIKRAPTTVTTIINKYRLSRARAGGRGRRVASPLLVLFTSPPSARPLSFSQQGVITVNNNVINAIV